MFKFDTRVPKVVNTLNAKGDRVGWRKGTTTASRYVYLRYANGVLTEKRCYSGSNTLREVTYLHSKTKSTVLYINTEGLPTRSEAIENGTYNGKYKEWDDKGNLRLTVNVKKGILHGILKFYYPNGDVEECVKLFKGKMHGFLKTYHTTGELHKMLEFKKGKSATSSTAYSREGLLVSAGRNLTSKETLSLKFINFWSSDPKNYTSFKEAMKYIKKKKISFNSGNQIKTFSSNFSADLSDLFGLVDILAAG